MKKPKISVVIPTHKDFRKVSKAVSSMIEQSLKPFEVIVIDNNSSENIYKKFKTKYKTSRKVKAFRLEENVGVTGGRNVGILNASKSADYILFFDHDMIADEYMLENLYKTLIKNKAGISTPKIYFKYEKNIIWAAGTDINLTTGKVIFRCGEDRGQYDEDQEVGIAPAAMLVKRDVIDKIGGFDDRYFATYEDSDFSYRAKKAGFKVFYSAKAVAQHDLERNIEQDAERLIGRAYWVARNRIIFMNKFSRKFYFFLLIMPIYSFYYFYLAISTKQINKFFIDYFRGIADGLIETLGPKIQLNLPFTYPWMVKRHLGGAKTILDVGSGDGEFMSQINSSNSYETTGVELFDDYIQKARITGAYNEIIKNDILKMKFKKSEFDAALCSQVIEHITKKQSERLFESLENFSKDIVLIGTPNGEYEQHEYDGNKLQEHHSFWTVKDFEDRGYKVFGQSVKFIYGETGLLSKSFAKNKYVKLGLQGLSYILSPISYYFPELGAHLIAVKQL